MLPWLTTQPLRTSTRQEIEDSVLMWLEPLSWRNGGYLRELGHYNGELDTQQGTDDLFARLLGNSPAILVATATSRHERRSTRAMVFDTMNEIELLLCSTHLRSKESRLIGDVSSGNSEDEYDTDDPGLYMMLDHVHALLDGRSSGVCEQDVFTPDYDDVVLQTPDFTLWRARFKVQVGSRVKTEDERRGLPNWLTLRHKHNLVDDDIPPPSTINPVVVADADLTE